VFFLILCTEKRKKENDGRPHGHAVREGVISANTKAPSETKKKKIGEKKRKMWVEHCQRSVLVPSEVPQTYADLLEFIFQSFGVLPEAVSCLSFCKGLFAIFFCFPSVLFFSFSLGSFVFFPHTFLRLLCRCDGRICAQQRRLAKAWGVIPGDLACWAFFRGTAFSKTSFSDGICDGGLGTRTLHRGI
jgi:hypothetical protein